MAFVYMSDLGQGTDSASLEAAAQGFDQQAADARASSDPAMQQMAANFAQQASVLHTQAAAAKAQEDAESAAIKAQAFDLFGKIAQAGATVGGAALLSRQQKSGGGIRPPVLTGGYVPPAPAGGGLSTGAVVGITLGLAAVLATVAYVATRQPTQVVVKAA